MRLKVAIVLHVLLNVCECFEEFNIVAIVEREQKAAHLRQAMKNLENLSALRHFASQIGTRQRQNSAENRINYKRVIVHKLVRSKCGDCVEKLLSSGLEISLYQRIETRVYLKTISTVPITTLFNQTILKFKIKYF